MKIIKGNRVNEVRSVFCHRDLRNHPKTFRLKKGFRTNYFDQISKKFPLGLLKSIYTLILTLILSLSESAAHSQNQNYNIINYQINHDYEQRKSLIILSQNQEEIEEFKLIEEIRDRVREEVDYTFNHATSLLSVFLIVLTFFPASAAIWIWFLQAKLAHKIEITKQEVDSFRYDIISQIREIASNAQIILDELKEQSHKAEEKIEQIQQDTLIQYSTDKGDNHEQLMKANDYAKQGDKFFLAGRLKQAVNTYNQALKIHPQMADVWNNRGVVLTRLKMFDEAICSYDRALQIRADYADAWNNRGVSLMKLGIYGEAIACFDNAIKIKPDFFSAWYNQARCYSLKGEFEVSLKSLEKAIDLNGGNCKEMIKNEPDFEHIRGHELFHKLIG